MTRSQRGRPASAATAPPDKGEGRGHERPQTGTRGPAPLRVAPTLAPACLQAGARLSKRVCSALVKPSCKLRACPWHQHAEITSKATYAGLTRPALRCLGRAAFFGGRVVVPVELDDSAADGADGLRAGAAFTARGRPAAGLSWTTLSLGSTDMGAAAAAAVLAGCEGFGAARGVGARRAAGVGAGGVSGRATAATVCRTCSGNK
jgi:hypothetical protein